jgi:hypothetical protein
MIFITGQLNCDMIDNRLSLREVMKMDLHDLIEQVACDLYVRSGKIEGRDIENWLEAEWLVKNRLKYAEEDLDDIF